MSENLRLSNHDLSEIGADYPWLKVPEPVAPHDPLPRGDGGIVVTYVQSSLDTFRSRAAELAARFEKYKEDYRRGGYDESTLRLEYLNPFFKALGWDVDNETGQPPHLREVRV